MPKNKLASLVRNAQHIVKMRRFAECDKFTRPFHIRYDAAPVQDKAVSVFICTHGKLVLNCRKCVQSPEQRSMRIRWMRKHIEELKGVKR